MCYFLAIVLFLVKCYDNKMVEVLILLLAMISGQVPNQQKKIMLSLFS